MIFRIISHTIEENINEALAISRAAVLEDALHHLAHLSRVAVVKRGEKGAVAKSGGLAARSAALKIDLSDTVEAGDAFDAGFLYGYFKGWPLDRSLRLACVCGSLSTRKTGGTAGQPDLQEALAALET